MLKTQPLAYQRLLATLPFGEEELSGESPNRRLESLGAEHLSGV